MLSVFYANLNTGKAGTIKLTGAPFFKSIRREGGPCQRRFPMCCPRTMMTEKVGVLSVKLACLVWFHFEFGCDICVRGSGQGEREVEVKVEMKID